jgi:hypothetical protein
MLRPVLKSGSFAASDKGTFGDFRVRGTGFVIVERDLEEDKHATRGTELLFEEGRARARCIHHNTNYVTTLCTHAYH